MLGLLRKFKISKYTDNYLSEKESTFLNYLFENFERSNLSYLLHEWTFFCFNKNDNFIFLYYKDFNTNNTYIQIDSEVLKNLYGYIVDIDIETKKDKIDDELDRYDTKTVLLEYINELLESKELQYSTITSMSKMSVSYYETMDILNKLNKNHRLQL